MAKFTEDCEWKEKLYPVLKIKVDEFETLGFERVTADDIWEYFEKDIRNGKMKKPLRLYQLVNGLLSFSINDYMNHLRIESLKGPNWFEGDGPLNLDSFDWK